MPGEVICRILHHEKDAFKPARGGVSDKPPAELWVGEGDLAGPWLTGILLQRPLSSDPHFPRKISVMLAKLHFIEYGYFPRALLFRLIPMIHLLGARTVSEEERSCSSTQRDKTEASPGLQILRLELAGQQQRPPRPHLCPCLLLLSSMV